jgi:ABC-type uncharacterized transport system permease subunit
MGEASVGLFWVMFKGLYVVNWQYTLEAELDRVLLRPMDPYLQILLDNLNLQDLPVLVLGLAVVGLGAHESPVHWTWVHWALTPVPFALAGFVPATFYMDRPRWALLAWVVGVACMAVGYGIWRISLRRYASSGS